MTSPNQIAAAAPEAADARAGVDDAAAPAEAAPPSRCDTTSSACTREACTQKEKGSARAPKSVAEPHRTPPRLPRYITKRKPDELLMYVRRIPADILAAGIYPQSMAAIRVCLGTRDWLAAQPKANQLTAQLDALWAKTRKERLTLPAPRRSTGGTCAPTTSPSWPGASRRICCTPTTSTASSG